MSDKTQEDGWEDEGGATGPEPTQKTLKGREVSMPKRRDLMGAFRKITRPVKKKP